MVENICCFPYLNHHVFKNPENLVCTVLHTNEMYIQMKCSSLERVKSEQRISSSVCWYCMAHLQGWGKLSP